MNQNYINQISTWYQSFPPWGTSSPTQSVVRTFLNWAKSDLEKHPIYMKNLVVGHPARSMYRGNGRFTSMFAGNPALH